MEIKPTIGIGAITFDCSPMEVRTVMAEEKELKDPFLPDALCYKSLTIYFHKDEPPKAWSPLKFIRWLLGVE